MFCDRTEEFLREKGVEFAIRNIAEDEGAIKELERMGKMTTPVAVIVGEAGREEVVVGFDRAGLERALGL